MKILYASNYLDILNKVGCPNDYMNDVLFHGLTELEDVEVVDSTRMDHLYKSHRGKFPTIYGNGFTTSYLLDDINIDRSNLEQKIKDKYFDYIIYGAITRSRPYYDIVSQVYPENKIAVIDGDDSSAQCLTLQRYTVHHYFKRELLDNVPKFHPIHFAIPSQKIRKKVNPNLLTQHFASSIPYHDDGYKFTVEQEYYDDYYNAKFGITMKKAGWDCMRHYEIMANACIPIFINFDNCPKRTLTNLDRDLMKRCNYALNDFSLIKDLKEEILEYTRNNLTTKQLAKYVLETIIS